MKPFPHIFFLVIIHGVRANNYGPHIYPDEGPFFEGWYARLTDHQNARSLGILFGTVLPEKSSEGAQLSYLALLRSNGSRYSMLSEETVPNQKDILITVNGSTPTTDPDTSSPPNFQWVSKPNGYFNVTARSTVFDMTVGDVRFSGTFTSPVPWAPGGIGPEGRWLSLLPLPLHWFVYSLSTPGTYRWTNLTTEESLQGTGYLHQEKNWGESFPSEWIWTEGLLVNGRQNISFAGSFGTVQFGSLPVPALLFGYRNYNRGISLDFRPDNAIAFKELSPCNGSAVITIMSFSYTVTLDMEAKASNFQTCLCGPKRNGFVPVVTESYETVARIQVVRHYGLWDILGRSGVVVDDVTLERTALEFGGDYLCVNNPCSSKKSCN